MSLGFEYRWVIDGFTPDTLPMARLAEYMQQLARLLGNETAVRFVRVDEGSVALVSRARIGAARGKIDARIATVRAHTAPLDAMRAYDAINEMLAVDKTRAALKRGSATIIRFPGIGTDDASGITVHDVSSIVGYLYQLSEPRDEEFSARLRLRDHFLPCTAARASVDQLKANLFKTVRIQGRGRWRRDGPGKWRVMDFHILRADRVHDASLEDVVRKLRELDINWPDDPLSYLAELNEGSGALQ